METNGALVNWFNVLTPVLDLSAPLSVPSLSPPSPPMRFFYRKGWVTLLQRKDLHPESLQSLSSVELRMSHAWLRVWISPTLMSQKPSLPLYRSWHTPVVSAQRPIFPPPQCSFFRSSQHLGQPPPAPTGQLPILSSILKNTDLVWLNT